MCKRKYVDVDKINFETIPLYHYTSLSALKSIIENKTIRLSDYRFLNDPNELLLGIRECNKVCEMIAKNLINDIKIVEKANYYIDALKKLANNTIETFNFIKNPASNNSILQATEINDVILYVLSMSKKEDSLDMWSSYGKNGCCIKFNSAELFRFFHRFAESNCNPGFLNQVIRGNVNYNIQQEQSYILNTVNNFDLMSSKLNSQTTCYQLCGLYKSFDFEYENEYRCGFLFIDNHLKNTAGRINKIFFDDGASIKPQLEFRGFPINSIIEKIIISPFNKSPTAELGLSLFLKNNGFSNNIVYKSKIKIR